MSESASNEQTTTPVKVVKVPRFGRFLFIAFLLGALLGAVFTLIFPEDDPEMAPRKYVIVFVMLFTGMIASALTGGLLALRYRSRAKTARARAIAARDQQTDRGKKSRRQKKNARNESVAQSKPEVPQDSKGDSETP